MMYCIRYRGTALLVLTKLLVTRECYMYTVHKLPYNACVWHPPPSPAWAVESHEVTINK